MSGHLCPSAACAATHGSPHVPVRQVVDSPTYRVLKGLIADEEYHRILNEERVKYGLPPLNRTPIEGAPV